MVSTSSMIGSGDTNLEPKNQLLLIGNRHLQLLDDGTTVVTDDTTLRPHPTRKIFITSSNQFAKIFDSRTGDLLQTVVHPLIRYDMMGKPKITTGNTVLSADWSKDGKSLYVFSANHRSVSLWQMVD